MADIVADMQKVFDEADCLCSPEQVAQAINQMSKDITTRLAKSNPLIFCIMNGGVMLTGQLLPKLLFPLEQHYMHATRYRHATRGGELDWKVRPDISLQDRTILIIDDILDEGGTLAAIKDYCHQAGAREVLTAVLVDKQHDRKATPNMQSDFTGLYVEDRFLFGCGMDYKGYWRNAPGIYAVKGL